MPGAPWPTAPSRPAALGRGGRTGVPAGRPVFRGAPTGKGQPAACAPQSECGPWGALLFSPLGVAQDPCAGQAPRAADSLGDPGSPAPWPRRVTAWEGQLPCPRAEASEVFWGWGWGCACGGVPGTREAPGAAAAAASSPRPQVAWTSGPSRGPRLPGQEAADPRACPIVGGCSVLGDGSRVCLGSRVAPSWGNRAPSQDLLHRARAAPATRCLAGPRPSQARQLQPLSDTFPPRFLFSAPPAFPPTKRPGR